MLRLILLDGQIRPMRDIEIPHHPLFAAAKIPESGESILKNDCAGFSEACEKSAENGLQNRFSSTKTDPNTPCEAPKTRKVIHIVIHKCG